jgi:hypothetical protein
MIATVGVEIGGQMARRIGIMGKDESHEAGNAL